MRMTRFLAAGAAAVSLSAGFACGSDEATPLEAVQNASQETAAAKTAAIAMTIKGGQGALANATIDGAYDFDNRLLEFTIDASEIGVPGAEGTIKAVMDFGTSVEQYMRIPGLEDETGGKHWLKIDVAEAVASVCPDIDFAALLQTQSGDPTSGLQFLEGAKSVEEVGTEVVRGEDTKHYRVSVDVRDAAKRAPEASRKTLEQLAGWYTDPIQTTDVWIDGDGRARRYKQTTDPSALELPDCLKSAQPAQQSATTVTYEMFDFGKKVDIKVPASNDVVDIADLQG